MAGHFFVYKNLCKNAEDTQIADNCVPKILILRSGKVKYLNKGRLVQLTAAEGKVFHKGIVRAR